MKVFDNKRDLTIFLSSLDDQKLSLGFVPTMGALHQGHLSLVNRALKENDYVIISIYVNPTQFDNKSDLVKYPKTIDQDIDVLNKLEFQNLILFIPSDTEIYSGNFIKDKYDFNGIDNKMEGEYRSGHFDGVATIIKKLFDIIKPNKAYFGEKDYQQLLIVKKLVNILELPISIVGCPIHRNDQGLALSSRNTRLTSVERSYASRIYEILLSTKELFQYQQLTEIKAWVKDQFLKDSIIDLEYFEIADNLTLTSASTINQSTKYRAFIAVKINNIRLIDNIALN
tara:strand:+ start:71 stop:922 length:852 start_codon:yes stop_codon:yes gene_type:complete